MSNKLRNTIVNNILKRGKILSIQYNYYSETIGDIYIRWKRKDYIMFGDKVYYKRYNITRSLAILIMQDLKDFYKQ